MNSSIEKRKTDDANYHQEKKRKLNDEIDI